MQRFNSTGNYVADMVYELGSSFGGRTFSYAKKCPYCKGNVSEGEEYHLRCLQIQTKYRKFLNDFRAKQQMTKELPQSVQALLIITNNSRVLREVKELLYEQCLKRNKDKPEPIFFVPLLAQAIKMKDQDDLTREERRMYCEIIAEGFVNWKSNKS